MPTYRNQCAQCDQQFEQWQSIHASERPECPLCGGATVRVFTAVRTMGIGVHGLATQDADAREKRWYKDMPAYQRLRREGLQPAGIDGSDRWEATARSRIELETAGKLHVPDEIAAETKALAEDISAGRI